MDVVSFIWGAVTGACVTMTPFETFLSTLDREGK